MPSYLLSTMNTENTMKKLLMTGIVLVLMTSTVALAAPAQRGGFIGGVYGCCFGLRGAAAYNDGKDVIPMEWVDALLLGHIWSFIQGWSGTTTADLKEQYGNRFF